MDDDADRSSQPTKLREISINCEDDDADVDSTGNETNIQADVSSLQIPHMSNEKDLTTCQSSALAVSDLSDVPVKYELLRDDLERLKNHLQGSHQEALATVIAHAAQINSPEFRVPPGMTMTPSPVNADRSEAGQKEATGFESFSCSHTVKVPTDSYTWRKYGMKQVKTPEGSRSYYRCTYAACDAKKIESCDRFNAIVKIVYKGQHKHDPPKRVNSKGGEILSTSKSLKRKLISVTPIQVEQIDGSEIKHKLKNNNSSSGNPGLKNPKKPKFIVHAAADMEISADGYRWKKYGQKMVKGTPHPRNYYKCTSAGCSVRKHIEKVVDGSSEVTITYKGVHDHDMPVPKKGQGPPTTLTVAAASKNILQYKRKENLPTRAFTNEAVQTNESAPTRTLLSVGFEIKRC